MGDVELTYVANSGVNTMAGSGYVTTPLVQGDVLTVTFTLSYFSLRVLRAAEFTGLAAVGRPLRASSLMSISLSPVRRLSRTRQTDDEKENRQ